MNSLAGILQRTGGWLIDAFLVGIPATLVILPFIDLQRLSESGEYPEWALAIQIGAWVLYQVVLLAWFGRTVGALAVGVRVARYVDGKNPSIDQAALRALLPASFMALPIPFLNAGWVVVYLGALYNPLRRGFQDLAGGTIVIRTR